jgi:D-lactate dehydrogenase
MKIAFFSTQPYDIAFFESANQAFGHELVFFTQALEPANISLAKGAEAVCLFVNDQASGPVIDGLAALGVQTIALRCAGFNNIDVAAAKNAGVKVCRVAAYSPESVAEHAVALLLTLTRKTHKAYNRVREQNFALTGLLGFNLHGKKVGVIGTGNIGQAFCKIMLGFGCEVTAFDLIANKEMEALGVVYAPLIDVLASDIISLHCPLNEQTKHIINSETIGYCKKGVTIINTGRGGLLDTKAVIEGLKNGTIGALGLDVYEQEEKLFFKDLSSTIIKDDIIQRLMSFSNVLITGHQGFFTHEAMEKIAVTTLDNITKIGGQLGLAPANTVA